MDRRSGETAGLPARGASAVGAFRAVVCLQIVAMHVYPADLTDWFGPAAGWAVTHLRFGFESFFVLAGYFLAHAFRPGEWSYLSVPAFFHRRLVRLAVPYWAAITLGVAGFEASAWVRGRPYDSGGADGLWPLFVFVQDLVAPSSVPSVTYWFMAPLMQFYLLWGLLFWAVRWAYLRRGTEDYHDRTLGVMAWLVVAAMFGSLACVATGEESRWKLAGNAVYLCLGCLAYWWGLGRGVRVWALGGAAGLVAVGLWHGQSRPVAAVACAALLPYLVRHPRLPPTPLFRGLAALGERSYSVYLTHTYVAYRVMNWQWGFTAHDSPAAALGLWAVAVAASGGFGCAFYALVEAPTARASRGVRFRGPQPPAPPP